jgi:tetratricopeptide (TPR) repeat protein
MEAGVTGRGVVSFGTKDLTLPRNVEMKVAILTLSAAAALFAADYQKLARALKAQTDFDRVQLAPAARLVDAVSCVQSQASVIPVSSREELPLLHFRKGYCHLAAGALTENPNDFAAAAAEFHKATETWPARFAKNTKVAPEPVSAGVRVLAAVARLAAASRTEEDVTIAYDELVRATGTGACTGSLMPGELCQSVLALGRRWIGWVARRRGDLEEAERMMKASGSEAWISWTAGTRAFQAARFGEAATRYRAAVELWKAAASDDNRPLLDRLSPPPDLAEAYTELGGAQLLTGNFAAAVASLDTAVRLDHARARPLYLRARAKELAGQADAALADYNLASRTAFAGSRDLASGEAHLYRGILLYRRKDFSRAEDEFASALNLAISSALRADASAWRHLAAVSGGGCEASRPLLERALDAVSAYFPKQEARAAMAACLTAMSAGGAPPK